MNKKYKSFDDIRSHYLKLDQVETGYYPYLSGGGLGCSTVTMSGFGTYPPKHFAEFLDDVVEFYTPSYGLIISVILDSSLKYGEIMLEKGWEESPATSRSNYKKENLMKVFIKSLRPVTKEEVEHARCLQDLKAEKAQETKEKADKVAEAQKKANPNAYIYNYGYTYNQIVVNPPFDKCNCTICEALRKKTAKVKEKKVA